MKHLLGAAAVAWGIVTLGCGNDRPGFGAASSSSGMGASGSASTSQGDSGAADDSEASSSAPGGGGVTGERDSGGSETGAGGNEGGNTPDQTSGSGGPSVAEGGAGASAGGSSGEPANSGPSPSGSGGNGPMSNPPDSSFALGEECSTAQQCESGFCADGVCCDLPCNGVCAECAAPDLLGTCTAAAADEACPELSCPEDTECRTYELLDTGSCTGLGECALEANCESNDVASGTPCQDGAGACSGSGECAVPDKAALGEACTAADDCGSGFCADSASGAKVCCDGACDQTCQACGSDGFCAAVADDARCAEISCDADTMCADYPEPLSDNRCAAAGQCVQESAHCAPMFASATTSCGTGRFCDGAGACDDACTATQTWCTSACRDLSNDENNCGECGTTCPAGTSCVSGECECDGATEGLCQNACVDLATDVTNCGMCGMNCPQPSEAGSSRSCSGGSCGACGAYSQTCCSGATACSAGLSCSGGSCACAVNTHRCTTGAAAGTCRSNTDATACGNNCENCTQANAVAQCTSGVCNNTCRAGVSQLCAGTNGRPGCGSWDFEDGKQSWAVNLNFTNSASTLVEAGTIGAGGSVGSLAIPYNNLNNTKSGVQVRVPLCGTVSLAGKTITGSVRLQTTSGTPGSSDYGYVTIFSGNTGAGSAALITGFTPGSWLNFSFGLDSVFLLNPDALLSVTHVGITFNITDWSGTIHLDNFTISG